jgi:Domain of unknown function (DUF1707)
MKSHRTDGVSLTFGVFFLVLAAWYLLARLVDVDLPMAGWSVAGGLILLGLLGLVGALRSNRAAGPAPATAAEAAAPVDESPSGQPVTDTDRAPIAERLRAALDEGRLTFTEYNERLQQAYTALTYEELDRVLAGLPAPQAPSGPAADQTP